MPVDERALSEAQLLEMMGLLKGSDTVELKVTIPARGRGRWSRRSAWIRWTRSSGRLCSRYT